MVVNSSCRDSDYVLALLLCQYSKVMTVEMLLAEHQIERQLLTIERAMDERRPVVTALS
jgi:hypothetical protein